MKTREIPLFPGYLFCQLDPQMPLKILTTPGVLDIVGCKGRYLPVQKRELDDIRRALTASLTVRPWAAYERGDRVRIERGPLTGLEGEVAYVKSGLRLILRVNLLNRAVAVDLDQRWVQPVHRAALETYAAMTAMRRAG